MTEQYLTQPLDEISRERLASRGLRMSLVDLDDTAQFDTWLQADFRGFLGDRGSDEQLAAARKYQSDRRTVGIYDEHVGASPVATAQSWVADLTLPGLTTIPAWAISSITVAPTHRRQGIATNLLEAELRTAVALDVPVAILTVSESTIYHRFGFGPATVLTGWEIDTKRIAWRGRKTTGRLAFTEPDDFRETGRALLERIRLATPGEMSKGPYLADRLIGPLPGNSQKDAWRLVRFDDADGVTQGFVSYTLKGNDDDFAMHTLEIQHLAAATDDAYLALWRFALEHDLVGTVKSFTTADHAPLPLLVSDYRRARQVWREDHLWVRILDVEPALEARRYEEDGTIVLGVRDDLELASGPYRLTVQNGVGTVELSTDATDVRLDITALGSIYLGGVRARDLALRGEITGDVELLDRMFRTTEPPHLGSWF